MAYDGWLTYGGVELFNIARTAQLAEVLGIDSVLVDPARVEWIETELAGVDYDLISAAPWYDPDHPASAEFAGVLPLSVTGLDDSTLEASVVEYITDGGSASRGRHATLPIPVKVAVVASTARGADFGKRWLDRVLAGGGARTFCAGSEARYFQWAGAGSSVAHRRDVSLSRGTNVTAKRSNHCSHIWTVTYTWIAGDPFEYGEEIPRVTGLGTEAVEAPEGQPAITSGSFAMVEESCPVFDYTPIYDPLYPALVAPPTAPTFYPDGWDLIPGATFTRFWARVDAPEPSGLDTVPVVTLTTTEDARMVRVSIWSSDSDPDALCEPLWAAVVSYMPAGLEFVIDAEQEASYAWDGISEQVRRTDSLVFGNGALPMKWNRLNDLTGFLVTLDVMSGSDVGSGVVEAAVSLVPKSN